MSLKKLNLITKNHKSTKRNYIDRMINNKAHCMKVSKKYDFRYWDGDRKYGYGGYHYDGRWNKIAKKIIKKYKLNKNSKILDIGCGKGHLIYELKKILKSSRIYGVDISKYALKNCPLEIKKNVKYLDVKKGLKYKKNFFDLIISINLVHNLEINHLKKFIKDVIKISKKSFITTESYRNEKELYNLQCWALTCESFFSEKEWKWLFNQYGYNRDYELIFFE